ncbi:carboxynorspermidine decarboxylase [Helicobacter monodelphidis]|uniref:carboxynorspermidine decarboxylase n=1 Tax=Helicobacter sp. 15-1451 TaxID=2004995 RepID=UPI000DCD715A|nr:carboxynorspermidine decarboxylase [Helicobacter sp. 15-1451]RAX56826.1 carboxynorspermidine decarboxylase [Helicobacter sp. 15-1451]
MRTLYPQIPSPCYVLEEKKLIQNLEILKHVQEESGAKILLALKGFAMWKSFDLIQQYLAGVTASGIYEARLGSEEFKGEICVFSPAYKEKEIDELLEIADHIIFNSPHQLHTFKQKVLNAERKVDCGIRVNPLYSEVSPPIYNPCVEGSRLGITPKELEKCDLNGVSGLHFHTHCEQNSDALERTLEHFEMYFGHLVDSMKWVNFGGGHHITRVDYNVELLIQLIQKFRQKHQQVEVYLEPGEAIGWQCGFLKGSVVDIVHNVMDIAILDVSASAHMPDCLEMPYRPMVRDSSEPEILEHTYRFGGPTCLAGDVIGDYSFKEPLQVGSEVIFEDMVHYTIVKNNTFNGVPLPSIGCLRKDGHFELWKEFGYLDYKERNS